MKILIADDDAISRKVLTMNLKKWGYETVVAKDGTEAWEMLEGEAPPRMAILDWVMPGIDGLEICRRLRADETKRGIYVVLLTGKSDKSFVAQAIEVGVNDYMSKPFDLGELRIRILSGERVLDLQCGLADKVEKLQEAKQKIEKMQSIIGGNVSIGAKD
ncbi:response regulator transcription factor [Oligoflexia bacterium]|nr:response regulator transcription factor [Oligoflexia bacterium]